MLDFLKEQVQTRRSALKLQLDKEIQAKQQAENNINAIHGALQDVDFWEKKINETLVEESDVEIVGETEQNAIEG